MVMPILVAGEWRRGRGDVYASRYPADDTVNAELAAASVADVEEAIDAADAARRRPDWADLKPHERAAILYRVSALIRERSEELAQLQRRDNGKPINETRALVASAAGTFQFFAAACETLEETLTPPRGDYLTMSVHEPMGVIAAITPWNSPIASEAQKLAPALAAGNAVIVKPAEVTPLAALELGRICEQAGVPKGVVSVVPGKGSVIGDAIVKHPLVKKVSFTGGTTTGRALARLAADKLMPVTLELGGKSPTIVFADADLDHAVNGVLYGIFSSSGEACIAGSRLFVHESIRDAVPRPAGGEGERAASRRPGGSAHPDGPADHREAPRVDRALRRSSALDEGGKLLAGGERPKGGLYDRGWFYRPTIIDGLGNGARIARKRSSVRCWSRCPFATKPISLRRRTTASSGSPPASGRATTSAHGGRRARSRRARCGSTPTSSSRSRRRSPASRRAASVSRRAGSASSSTSTRRASTGD